MAKQNKVPNLGRDTDLSEVFKDYSEAPTVTSEDRRLARAQKEKERQKEEQRMEFFQGANPFAALAEKQKNEMKGVTIKRRK
jgi:hypothetical protein